MAAIEPGRPRVVIARSEEPDRLVEGGPLPGARSASTLAAVTHAVETDSGARPRWTPQTLDVGGLRMRVAERPGNGTPLLLITGIGAHLDMWGPLERQLDGRHLIAFDAPGTGGSDRPRLPLRMSGLARIIERLLDALGHDLVDVLGVSFGGALAQELALRHSERVRRLILCATSSGMIAVPPKPLPALLLMTPVRYYNAKLFRMTMPRIAGGRTARDPAVLARQAGARLAKPPDLLGYAYQLYATTGWTSLHWLHRLPQPTLVIAGDDDRAIPLVNARLLARRIPDARLHVVKGGGHLFVIDEPASVAGEIAAFLD
jgi:poly(3-hydroxyalkanoate) depolymerase